MENSELIPFGKYRGQPIESIAEDPQYMAWLVNQPWFAQRHSNIYQIVINNFAEPSETPDHNAMQAKFLDADWRKKFMEAAGIQRWHAQRARDHNGNSIDLITDWIEFSPDPEFEICGIDVSLPSRHSREKRIAIELKPSVGDDYPAILRTMLTSRKTAFSIAKLQFEIHALVVGHFYSQAVTEDQFRAIFKASGVQVVFVREIESSLIQPKPEIPEFVSLMVNMSDCQLSGTVFSKFLGLLRTELSNNVVSACMFVSFDGNSVRFVFPYNRRIAFNYCQTPENTASIHAAAKVLFPSLSSMSFEIEAH